MLRYFGCIVLFLCVPVLGASLLAPAAALAD
jgi:hypothetical protein